MVVNMDTNEYFEYLSKEIQKNYDIAEKAREKGLDPSDNVEVPLALTMAAKVVKLVATIYPQLDNEEVINRVLELEKQYGALDASVSFTIAEEIAKEKFCKFENQLEAIDAGIRTGFAYITLGVVSSPIEGYTGIKTGKTQEGETYIKAFFSGPIRSAGTTASCVALILIDYLRQLFGYAKYDAVEKECKRVVTELYDYHERVTNLQYLPTEEEAYFIAENLPIQVAGEPTEKREVLNYKNLERVETDFIRGGFCLILGEGLAQKAAKGLRILRGLQKNGFKINDWEWLDDYLKLHEKREKGKADESPTYIKDLVAGRPVFGHPGRGFRFRYGRSRVAGFSAVSVHPATMAITDDFIATGTQLKIEKPTKGCVTTPCEVIEGPIVKLVNGNVVKPKDYEEGKKIYKEIEEIIYLGDILFPLGDVINRNAMLIKPGYVEEWWELELKEAVSNIQSNNINKKDKKEGICGEVKQVNKDSKDRIDEDIDYYNIGLKEAIGFSEKYNIPLYPDYIFYWTQINYKQFLGFIDWFQHSRINKGKLLFPYNKSEKERFQIGKRALELLGIVHEVGIENIVLDVTNTSALLLNLGFDKDFKGELNISFDFKGYSEKLEAEEINEGEMILEIINKISKFKIKDKAGEFIGARMGRPEKSKLRKLTGSPSVLFPIGSEGGRLRSVNEAVKVGSVKSNFPFNYCKKCNRETVYRKCEVCGEKTIEKNYCSLCRKEINTEKCEIHERGSKSKETRIDIKHYFDKAKEKLGLGKYEVPVLIKGVRGTSSENHTLENLAKGILRAKYHLCVNKDGTIRYDGTELPLTHFKPNEIEVSVEKLKELGYVKDYLGVELKNEEQILELKPHDVILPCNNLSGDESGDEVFMNIANFIDELLVKFYDLPAFYNVKKKEDLVGQLGVCMAPHNCAGVICRIIGFSKVQGLFASPYMHAAIRRDCVYPSTSFVYSNNKEINVGNIGDYVENLIKKGNKISKLDSYGTKKIELGNNEKNIYALGVNPKSKKLVKKKIKYFVKGKPPKKWIKIKTSSGREQIMTPRHKFIYLDDENNFQIKQAKYIKKGDKIALLKNFNLKEKEIISIFLPEFLSENIPLENQKEIRIVSARDFFRKLVENVGKAKIRRLLKLESSFKNLSDWYGLVPINHVKILVDLKLMKWIDLPKSAKMKGIFNTKKWDLNLKVGKDLVKVLGYYAAEGYSRKNKTVSQVCFRIMDKDQKNKLIDSIKKSFGLRPSLGENETKITICNKLVYYLFKYCFKCGENAYMKKVPNLLYNVSEGLVKDYLSAYFDGDGTIIYGSRKFVCFYSVSRELLSGISLLGERFGLFARFYKTKERLPGKKVLERYKELNKPPKKHILQHLVYSGKDFYKIIQILNPVCKRKLNIIRKVDLRSARVRKIKFENKFFLLEKIGDIVVDKVKEIKILKDNKNSYCFEVDWKSQEDKNVLWGEQILNARCDGDEMAVMLLSDVLINFSKKFLPAHRGGTQDAPLVLNGQIRAEEVDDQILDLELVNNYPLDLYLKAEKKLHSSKIEIEMVKQRLAKNEDNFINTGFTHNTFDFNQGAKCSSYKTIPTMKEKVRAQMQLCEKLRSVDTGDVARLIIDRHFMKDLKGNLRKFSQQTFRCTSCNTIYRRPPLNGKCPCGGNIIFTIAYGSIVKYMEHGLELTRNYDVPEYIKQDLILTKRYIESIFGKDNEKQEPIDKWF